MIVSMSVGLTAGLTGSLHCVMMCGGIISALSLSPSTQQRWVAPLLYSLGRVTTYILLGVLFASLGAMATNAFEIQRLLFLLANTLLIIMGISLFLSGQMLHSLESIGYWLWRQIQPLAIRLTLLRNPAARFACGMLWGFLPCSMIYAMLAQALLMHNPLDAAVMMTAFGLGTLPAIVAVGWVGSRLVSLSARRWIQGIGGVLLVGYGIFGLYRPIHNAVANPSMTPSAHAPAAQGMHHDLPRFSSSH